MLVQPFILFAHLNANRKLIICQKYILCIYARMIIGNNYVCHDYGLAKQIDKTLDFGFYWSPCHWKESIFHIAHAKLTRKYLHIVKIENHLRKIYR